MSEPDVSVTPGPPLENTQSQTENPPTGETAATVSGNRFGPSVYTVQTDVETSAPTGVTSWPTD